MGDGVYTCERIQVEVGNRREFDFVEFSKVSDQVLPPITATDNGDPEFVHDRKQSPSKIWIVFFRKPSVQLRKAQRS